MSEERVLVDVYRVLKIAKKNRVFPYITHRHTRLYEKYSTHRNTIMSSHDSMTT